MILSVLVQTLEQFDSEMPGLPIQGANVLVASWLKLLASDERVEAMEVFLPPAQFQRQDVMAYVARWILPANRRGKDVLRFYPVHSLPDVWKDGAARVLLCLDPEAFPRDRYLRDRFAAGPMPILCQTHGLGHQSLYLALARVAQGEPVAHDVLLCLGRACENSMRRAFDGYIGQALPFRLEQMSNPVDLDLFHPAGQEEKLRARRLLRLPESGTVSLFCGRLTPNAKADLLPLLRQFAKHSSEKDTLFIYGGEAVAGYAGRLAQEGKELGLGERLVVRPTSEPLARPLVYAAADLFIFPADNIQESFGNVVVEAMAAGLPVISSDWAGMRDHVMHGETGYLIPTYLMGGLERIEELSPACPMASNYLMMSQSVYVDPKKLGEAIGGLLNDPGSRFRMGERGRARAEELYSWEAVSKRFFTIADESLGQAKLEQVEAIERRREFSKRLGMPVPYELLFEPDATRLLANEDAVRLSDHGANVMDGRETLRFYDETLSVIRPQVVQAVMDAVAKKSLGWFPIGELVAEVSANNRVEKGDVQFHIGLLLKRDVLELQTS